MTGISEKHLRVEKLWGSEEILTNTPLYCGKILRIRPGFKCSLHYHPIKTETFLVQHGRVALELRWPDYTGPSEVHELWQGESVTLHPGVAHRFWALSSQGATVIEFSTEHQESDVVRLEDSRSIAD